jgi:hypothetical protein
VGGEEDEGEATLEVYSYAIVQATGFVLGAPISIISTTMCRTTAASGGTAGSGKTPAPAPTVRRKGTEP